MPMKGRGRADLREIDRFDGGVGWIAYPDEGMERASHALVGDDGGVWVIDPVDAPDLDDLLADLGDVAGVVVGLDRHKRDSAVIARRHDVPVYVPEVMRDVAADLDAETVLFSGELGESGYESFTIVDNPLWHEVGLYHRDSKTLVVPEALGTADHFCSRSERLGVHPMLRAVPPKRQLTGIHPERILVGHGDGILVDADAVLSAALTNSRKNMVGLYIGTLRKLLPT